MKAFDASIQGYFKKEDDLSTYKLLIQNVLEYWSTSLAPSTSLWKIKQFFSVLLDWKL